VAPGPGIVYHRRVNFRPYTPSDRDACLAIFDSNCPTFVVPSDRPQFEAYLTAPRGRFGVLVADDGEIVGCGGVTMERGGRDAHLVLGLIRADRHHKGLGRSMTLAQLRWIAETPGIQRVLMETGQRSLGFYEKLGFRVVKIIEDGYAEGLHRCSLELPVDDALRMRVFAEQWIRAAERSLTWPSTDE
jgi:ribosomal protein S18 acetylase RimI-like enzyme